jgi:hypothetical protein
MKNILDERYEKEKPHHPIAEELCRAGRKLEIASDYLEMGGGGFTAGECVCALISEHIERQAKKGRKLIWVQE